MSITLETAQTNLAAWVAASQALALGQEHRIGDRMIRHSDGAEVTRMINFWQGKVNSLLAAASGQAYGTSRYVVADFSDR